MSGENPSPTQAVASGLFEDIFGRVQAIVHRTLDGLGEEELSYRPDSGANSIAWLVWHLTRVQDDHVASAFSAEQVWQSQGWYEQFGLPFEASDIGFGHTSEQVAQVRVDADRLRAYHDATFTQTIGHLRRLHDSNLEQVIDRSWDPPVTLGVRLVSVTGDNLQHAGQAAYVRGVVKRVLHGESGLEFA